MPLQIPQLDDRRFKDLAATLRDQIPGFTREWTDFNPSDSGITLLELWSWLAEMVLYRINTIPKRGYDNLYRLVLDPPEPVTLEMRIEVIPPFSNVSIVIPAGIPFRSRPCISMTSPPGIHSRSDDGRWVFETFADTPLPTIPLSSPPDLSPPESVSVTFRVRSRVVVENEELGVSDGKPDQIFEFRQGQVLIDENNVGIGSYNPNPRIKVVPPTGGPESWVFVPDFLETTAHDSPHFMVEPRTNRIRFGNGKEGRGRGKIPPSGARIIAERYQIVLGKEVRIDENSIEDILDWTRFPFSPGEIVEMKNEQAEGGEYLYSFRNEAMTTGLQLYQEEFRAIAPEDFAGLAVGQFNRAQESDCVPERPEYRVARASVAAGKKIQEGRIVPEPSAISVLILPRTANPMDLPVVSGPEFERLRRRVFSFLNRRRLITTRLYVTGPQYVPITLRIEGKAETRTNTQQLKSDMTQRIEKYFHPLHGGAEDTGWPMGRAVHKSELFQLVEGVNGVDHVDRIVMNGDPARHTIELSENQLPFIENIEVQL